jgi:hypothetical protein
MRNLSCVRRILLVVTLCAACNTRSKDRSAVDQLLDVYTPGFRLDETLSTARQKDPHLYFPAGGSANYTDTSRIAADGFTLITLIFQFPEYDTPPDSTERVQRIELAASAGDSAVGTAVATRVRAAFGTDGHTTCDRPLDGHPWVHVKYWIADGRGVALVTPLRTPHAGPRLIFFKKGWDLGLKRRGRCPAGVGE